MRVVFAAALLLASIAFAEPIYKWVDKDGEEHFTNDPTSIPAGQKTEITTGDEIGVLETKKGAPTVNERSPERGQVTSERVSEDAAAEEREWRQRFRNARDRLAELEVRVQQDQQKYEQVKDMETSFTTGRNSREIDSPAARAKGQLKQDQTALKHAKEELDDLEHEASKQAVPRAWRQ